MKNLLSENMLRFGTKNLSESQQRALTLKGIMKTINEHGLHNEVRWHLDEAVTSFDQTSVSFTKVTPLAPGQASSDKTSFMPYSFVMKNNGPSEAIITSIMMGAYQGQKVNGQAINPVYEPDGKPQSGFVVTAGGKPFPFDASKGGYIVPAGKSFRINTALQITSTVGFPEMEAARKNPGDLRIRVYGNFPIAETKTAIPPIVTNPKLGVVSKQQAMAKLGISGM